MLFCYTGWDYRICVPVGHINGVAASMGFSYKKSIVWEFECKAGEFYVAAIRESSFTSLHQELFIMGIYITLQGWCLYKK